jgi:hypothetical protein
MKTKAEASSKRPATAGGKTRPVVVYPFKQPDDYSDLAELYGLVAQLDADTERYARPITVVDRKTFLAMEGNKAFLEFRKNTVAKHSDIIDAWCVDTCQMWYTGLGAAAELGGPDDIFWLIPGDFNYGSGVGKEVLGRLHDLPEIIAELGEDLCVGEITADHNNSKQLIDTYGTFALLYNWFPAEAREIRKITERPRSEFFAIRGSFLREALGERWFAYEQTLVLLLKAVTANKRISRFQVGEISDLPMGRDSFSAAIQQVERVERVLRAIWRERNQSKADWTERYQALQLRSAQIHDAAFTALRGALAT